MRKILISLILLFTIVSCSFNLGEGGARGKDGLDGTSATETVRPQQVTDSTSVKK